MNKYNPLIHHRRSIRLKGYDYSQAGSYFITMCCDKRIHRFGKVENGEMILNEFGLVAYHEWAKLPERFPNFELDVFQIMPNHMHGIITLADAPQRGASINTLENPARVGFTPTLIPIPIQARVGFTPTLIQAEDNEAKPQLGRPLGSPQLGSTARATLAVAPPTDAATADGTTARVASAAVAPTIGDIVGAYKSLVTNACIKICNSKNIRLGKLWQRDYYEVIIRNEQAYQRISNYIINNPTKWEGDKFFKKGNS